MSVLINNQKRIVPTWLEAIKHLIDKKNRTESNIVLDIETPEIITTDDLEIINKVNSYLRTNDKRPLNTVASTIFPISIYKKYGRPDFYDKYLQTIKRGREKQSWGTYAERMMSRKSTLDGSIINPLELIVRRISNEGQATGKSFKNSYELGISLPEIDLTQHDIGGELPTYMPEKDQNRWYGLACLSHLSFKRVPKDQGHAVDLSVMYRSHRYCERALGNLIGLAQLMHFVANESNLQIGRLTCISTHAELDVNSWGGIKIAESLISKEN